MSAPLLRPLAFGEVLDSAFTLYRRNFAVFVGAALVPTLPMLAVAWMTGMGGTSDPATFDGAAFVLFFVVAIVATLLMWGALAHLASQAYGGIPAGIGEGLQVALRRFFPLLGAAILAGIILSVAFFAVMLVMMVGFLIVGMISAVGGAAGSVVGTVIGIVVLVAMVVLYAAGGGLFFALVPAVVVERKGPSDAIARTFELARGAMKRLIGLVFVCLCIVYLPILGVLVLTGTFSTMYDPAAAAAAAGSPAMLLQQVVTWGSGALTTPFLVGAMVVQYYDRRVRTEALDVQAAAERLVPA